MPFNQWSTDSIESDRMQREADAFEEESDYDPFEDDREDEQDPRWYEEDDFDPDVEAEKREQEIYDLEDSVLKRNGWE